MLLLLAAGAGAVLLGEVRDGLLVLVGLIPIVGADVVTEYRGERALEALRDASAPMARVRRDGTVVARSPAAELVPGDVVLLSGGDVVPADLRLIRVDRLQLDRSVLTGESIPEHGRTEPDPPGTRPRRPAVDRLRAARASSAGAARGSSSPPARRPSSAGSRAGWPIAAGAGRRSSASSTGSSASCSSSRSG